LARVDKPDLGYFLEVKSRTWSRPDADHKAGHAIKLLDCLGIPHEKTVKQDYLEIVETG